MCAHGIYCGSAGRAHRAYQIGGSSACRPLYGAAGEEEPRLAVADPFTGNAHGMGWSEEEDEVDYSVSSARSQESSFIAR